MGELFLHSGDLAILGASSVRLRKRLNMLFNKIATSRGPTQKRGTRVSTVKQSARVQTQRDARWAGMAWHCTVLYIIILYNTPRTQTIFISMEYRNKICNIPEG